MFDKVPSDREMYRNANRDHKLACGGDFMSFEEFMSQPFTERKNFVDWLRREARDVRREAHYS